MGLNSISNVTWWGFIFLELMQLMCCSAAAAAGGDTVAVDEGRNYYITWDDMKVDDDIDDHHKMKMMRRKNKQSLDFIGNGTTTTTTTTTTATATTTTTTNNNSTRVIVVDKNGSGDSLTVQGAIDMVPDSTSDRVKIYILPGIYREKVTVPASKPYISLIGNPNQTNQTVITWNDKASDKAMDGSELGTYRTASVTILSDYFCATAITFQNSIVAVSGSNGMQAVALRIAGDKAMFYGVRILGTQDTLLDDTGSHYFYKCYIEGTVDFVFGRARSLYKDCILHSTAERFGAIAAHHRDSPYDDTGFSFIHCTINGSGTVYLGRAWGNYSRAIYSYCDIGDIITPSGWSDWNNPSRDKTAVFGEFQCSGKGADRRYRVPWSKSLSFNEARPFLDMKFIYGEQWLKL